MNTAKYCRQQPERFDCMFKERLLLSKSYFKKTQTKTLQKAVQPHLSTACKAYDRSLKNLLQVL